MFPDLRDVFSDLRQSMCPDLGNVFGDVQQRLQDACERIEDAKIEWFPDETKEFGVSQGGNRLPPRECKIRHIKRFGLSAHQKVAKAIVRLKLPVSEYLLGEKPTFTLYDQGIMFGPENGWRIQKIFGVSYGDVDLFLECD